MDIVDIVAAVLATVVTTGLLAGFDLATGGSINWLFDGVIGVTVGALVVYLRTADLEDAETAE